MLNSNFLLTMLISIVVFAGCSAQDDISKTVVYDITAKQSKLNVGGGDIDVWTLGGDVPGTEIRIKEGQTLKVNLTNELPVPTSIHWHGMPVPNAQDGVPGVTQNAVQPGETYTYEFKADTPGTYWYHSHQHSAFQVDKGVMGSIIVESKDDEKYDRDYALMLDEWIGDKMMYDMMLGGNELNMMHHNMSDMDMEMSNDDMDAMNANQSSGHEHNGHSHGGGHDMSAWDTFTVNGKTNDQLEVFEANDGELIKVRLMNAGHFDHYIRFSGTDYKITHSDGQPINKPEAIEEGYILIGPGQRYDVEFTYDSDKNIYIERIPDMNINKSTKIYFHEKSKKENKGSVTKIDIFTYGENKKGPFDGVSNYDVEYHMELGQSNAMNYTINGKTWGRDDVKPISIKENDKIKVIITNPTNDAHPMHLHGHFFQIISMNGEELKDSPIVRDTILLMPDDEFEIAFKADNPGNWLFHCHKLHHAMGGMLTKFEYENWELPFIPDPNAGNALE